jgi:hypothetical protein
MPRFDIVFIDPFSFVHEAFPQLAALVTAGRGPGGVRTSLRVPHIDAVREECAPATRQRLEAWLRSKRRGDALRPLSSGRFEQIRPEILRRLHNVASHSNGPAVAVLTLDVEWAHELHRSYPGLPLLRYEGRGVCQWFASPAPAPRHEVVREAPREEPREVQERRPSVARLRRLDDGPTADRLPLAAGLALGGALRGGTLGRCIASGGEGWIQQVVLPDETAASRTLVCKVLKRPSAWRRSKLEWMLAVPQRPSGAAWPTALVGDARGDWLGFLLPKVPGDELQHVLQRVWSAGDDSLRPTRRQLARLAQQSVARIEEVHALGVLVGDVQPKNLLATDDDVVLIDTDSFQVDGYPCPVGIVEFLHPELLGRDLKQTLRTPLHERFAVATLVFQTLMGRQSPYAHIGGGTPLENQRKGHFPYRAGVGGLRGVPQGSRGPTARMWGHLSPELQQAFRASFEDRTPPELPVWRALLAEYEEALGNGLYSNEAIPPARLKSWRTDGGAPR